MMYNFNDIPSSEILPAESRSLYLSYRKKKNITYWKRKYVRRVAPMGSRIDSNLWVSQWHYFLYCSLIGNGLDGFNSALKYSLDLSGGYFLVLIFTVTFLVALPYIYMEVFLGRYTQMTNSQLYRASPMFFGFCTLVFCNNALWYPIIVGDAGVILATLMLLVVNPNILTTCPPNSSTCYNVKTRGPVNSSCTYHPTGLYCEKEGVISYTANHMYRRMFQPEDSTKYMYNNRIVGALICWVIIIILCIIGMRALCLFLKWATFINIFIHCVVLLMAFNTSGSIDGINNMFNFKSESVDFYHLLLVASLYTAKIGLTLPQGYMTYSAYARHHTMLPAAEAIVICGLNFILTFFNLLFYYSIIGVLAHNMNVPQKFLTVPYAGMYCGLVPEFLTFHQCPIIFISSYLLSCLALEVIKIAISVHMFLMNLYDFVPRLVSYPKFTSLTFGVLQVILSMIWSSHAFAVRTKPTLWVADNHLIQPLRLFITGVLIFYVYGISRLQDDIHFLTGRSPIKFWIVLWIFLPILIIMGTAILAVDYKKGAIYFRVDSNSSKFKQLMWLCCLMAFASLIITFVATFMYIVVSVRIVNKMINLIKPQFHWGPPTKEARIARKTFTPSIAIRSEPPKKLKMRFRINCIKQRRERFTAEKIKRGQLFLDTYFFTNVGYKNLNPIEEETE